MIELKKKFVELAIDRLTDKQSYPELVLKLSAIIMITKAYHTIVKLALQYVICAETIGHYYWSPKHHTSLWS